MGILRTIAEMGMAAQGAVNIHESAKHFTQSVKIPVDKETDKIEVTLSMPAEVQLNTPVLFTGTAPRGYVEIYSYDVKEKQVDVGKDHTFAGMLYFSKPGVYELYAMYLGIVKSNDVKVICK